MILPWHYFNCFFVLSVFFLIREINPNLLRYEVELIKYTSIVLSVFLIIFNILDRLTPFYKKHYYLIMILTWTVFISLVFLRFDMKEFMDSLIVKAQTQKKQAIDSYSNDPLIARLSEELKTTHQANKANLGEFIANRLARNIEKRSKAFSTPIERYFRSSTSLIEEYFKERFRK